MSGTEIQRRAEALDPWFHQMKRRGIFQSLRRGNQDEPPPPPDDGGFEVAMPLQRRTSNVPSLFERADFPVLHFIEKRYSNDPTNRWISNRACAEAMLRNAGSTILNHPEEEVYLCRVNPAEGMHR